MQKSSVFFVTLISLITSLVTTAAHADIEWSGVYRIEANNFSNPELGGKRQGSTDVRGKRELNYALSHLVLRPKIVAGDGLTIYGQFDIFNNGTYPNSGLGQVWGNGVNGDGTTATTEAEHSNVMAKSKPAETLTVSQLYLTLTQENGALIVGRVPIQFGLGMTHSAGRGLFDHWYETSDLVGYKFVVGNLWFMPMMGKAAEGGLNMNSDDVNDLMLHVQYEIPESDIEAGVFYQQRSGGDQAHDAPAGQGADPNGTVLGDPTAKNSGKANMKTISLYALKDTERYRFGAEASFQSGETGVVTNNGNGDNVTLGGFGIAAEFELRPEGSNWKWGVKAGTATGDDPTTTAKFEGFLFNRNYDVAMLMFNHPLGADDFMRTRLITGNVRDANGDINTPDVETISNVIYLAPSARYTLSDRWSLDNTLITGWLATNPMTGGKNPGKDLGYEWDISLNFAPRKGVMWVNQLGMLFPGNVWKGDGSYESSFAFGLTTKAAISF